MNNKIDLSNYSIDNKDLLNKDSKSSKQDKPTKQDSSIKKMGRPFNGTSRLNKNIRVNFSDDEYNRIIKNAEKNNTPIATYLKNKLKEMGVV